MTSLKKQTIHGVKWQIGIGIFQKIISVLVTIVIARRLGPSVFGLFSLALIIVASFELFKSMGIDSALVRRGNDFDRAANTAFRIIPLIGIILYIILYFIAPFIGGMLNHKELSPIIRVLGVAFIFTCFSKIPTAYLERNMQFKKLSIAEFYSNIGYSTVAIILVFYNFGVWALVFAYIARVSIHMFLVWTFAKWRPIFEFDNKLALEMINFGKYLLLGAVLYFVKMNLDNLLVGNLLGVSMLGFYSISFNLANFGSDYLGRQISRVMFSSYSKLKDNQDDLQKAFLNVLKYISIIALPLGFGTFLLGGEFIKITYGNKWLEAIPILRIIVWAGMFNFIAISMDSVLLALGKSKLYFWSVFIQVVIFFIFILPMAKLFGVNGVGMVVVIAAFIAMMFEFVMILRLFSVHLREIYLSIRPGMIGSFVMLIVTYLFNKNIVPYIFNLLPVVIFIIEFSFAVTIYMLCLFLIEKQAIKEIKTIISG